VLVRLDQVASIIVSANHGCVCASVIFCYPMALGSPYQSRLNPDFALDSIVILIPQSREKNL
jgi:hypothetical protein